MWLSLVERCVRDAEAAGSNPVISTTEQVPFFELPLKRVEDRDLYILQMFIELRFKLKRSFHV